MLKFHCIGRMYMGLKILCNYRHGYTINTPNTSHLSTSNGVPNYGSDSGTSSGLASLANNNPEIMAQMYYQNFEDAARDIQKLNLQFALSNETTPKDKPAKARRQLKPDLLQNTFSNRTEHLLFHPKSPSDQPSQNIYANDDFIPSEVNDPSRYKLLQRPF